MSTNQYQLNVISNWDRRASITIIKIKAELSWPFTLNPLNVETYGPSGNPIFDADDQSAWSVGVVDDTGSWSTGAFGLSFPEEAAGGLYSFIIYRNPNSCVGVLAPSYARNFDLKKL